MSEKEVGKACLIVIDGWGLSDEKEGNAVFHAKTPVMDKFEKEYQFTKLSAHGLSVGLPDGLMGNSEVGHLNLGAGRIVYQDIVRIDQSIKDKSIRKIPALQDAFKRAKEGNKRLHLLGLVSDGGVHSHLDHLYALLEAAKAAEVPHVFIHFFGDGRDTKPKSSVLYAEQLLEFIKKENFGSIATCTGRYYAMDRDKRWERIKIAYDGLVAGEGEESNDLIATINKRFEAEETDEFLKPIILNKDGLIGDGDTLLFFNYRSDRMREIVESFGFEKKHFEPKKVAQNLGIYNFTQYKSDFPFKVMYPPQSMDNVLAEWLGKKKVAQYHVAETEKYAHVTFFFNGGSELEFEKEERKLVPSPKVATYDLKPEMSCAEVAEEVAKGIATGKYPFVMCNFAPPDMVGHTGKYEEAVKAVEATDAAIGVVFDACQAHGYTLFVTADHGNAEQMISATGGPHTAHTCNPVPFVMTSKKLKFPSGKEGALCDVAPTILEVMGIEIPEDMNGKSLILHE